VGHDLPHAQHSEVIPALLWIEIIRREQERPLIKVRAALGKPFYKHCPKLHGANSDWLFLQFGNRSRKQLSKSNSRTDS
jgi:hypothetical protein